MTAPGDELATVRLAGTIVQGAAVDTRAAGAHVSVPREKLDADDLVYRVGTDLRGHGIERGDLLIVEPRPDGAAATGELVVVVTPEGRAFIGRWWRKGGRRALLDHALQPIAEGHDLRVIGAVTVVIREH